MHHYGIQGVGWNWFRTYIKNRKQKVQINSQSGIQESICKWETIKSGIPQGSILGPLLFIVYVNDFPRLAKQLASPVMYADDTSLLVAAKDLGELEGKVKATLKHITDWFSINGLTLNMEKTNFIKFSANHSKNQGQQNVFINNSIEEVNNTTFLGLELDNNINWKNHVGKILPKLSRACYVIRTMYPISSLKTLRMIYFAYFHSILEYGIIFWGNSTESKKIFLVQKRIIRIMTGSKTRASCKSLYQSLGILTLTSKYILSLMKFLI